MQDPDNIRKIEALMAELQVEVPKVEEGSQTLAGLSFVIAASICASTVVLKQHSVVDGFGAMVMACAAFAFAFATAPFKAIRLSELAYSSGKSVEIYIFSEVSSIS